MNRNFPGHIDDRTFRSNGHLYSRTHTHTYVYLGYLRQKYSNLPFGYSLLFYRPLVNTFRIDYNDAIISFNDKLRRNVN